MSRGYRLVTDTECDVQKGLNLLPLAVKCASVTPSGGISVTNRTGNSSPVGAIVAVVVVLGLIACLIGLIFYIRKNQKFRSALYAHLPDRFKDSFGNVQFKRLSFEEEEASAVLADENEPKELDDATIQAISTYSTNDKQ